MPFLDHVQDAVADDHHHVAELHHVGLIADPAMARDHVGAAFLVVRGHHQLQNVVQRGDLALHAAAALDVDERIAAGREDVAGAHHVRAAEQNDAVAIGVGKFALQTLAVISSPPEVALESDQKVL